MGIFFFKHRMSKECLYLIDWLSDSRFEIIFSSILRALLHF